MTDRAFNQAVDIILEHEGGYVDHPEDPGGETNHGITKRVAVEDGYTGSMRDLTVERAKTIYYKNYWLPVKANKMPEVLARNVFDAAVNHGVRAAIRFLQRAMNVPDDGIIGPGTLRALRHSNEVNTVTLFNANRLEFYTKLKTFPTFGRGWTRRVAANMRMSIWE